MRPYRAVVRILLLVSGLVTDGQAADPSAQVVVLRNGNILRGAVEKSGERLRVTSAGSEVHLRTADVDLLCESVEAAYQQLRARNVPPTAVGHMQLAAWCVRQELWNAAQTELAAARQLEPNHPRLVILEQTAAYLQRVAQLEPPTRAARESTNRPKQPASSTTEGAELLADLPEGALEDFTRRVQPILVNNCTTSGCHRVDGPQQFQLNRDLLHGMANRRSTLRNLTAALGQIDIDAPLESLLLERASIAHGGKETPPLPIHQPELRERLEDWLLLASGKTPPEPTPSEAAVQLAGGRGVGTGEVVPTAAVAPLTVEQRMIAAEVESEALLAPRQSGPPQVGVKLRSWTPRDEFDPEIFNRQQTPSADDSVPGAVKK